MKENNKLLAEFLGIKPKENNWFDGYDLQKLGLPFNYGIMGNGTRDLKFHTDWNWLMIVAERIETTETKDGRTFTIDMHRDSVLIFEYGTHTNEIIFTEGKGRLENLYNACVEFVEWWNKEEYQKAVMNSIDLE